MTIPARAVAWFRGAGPPVAEQAAPSANPKIWIRVRPGLSGRHPRTAPAQAPASTSTDQPHLFLFLSVSSDFRSRLYHPPSNLTAPRPLHLALALQLRPRPRLPPQPPSLPARAPAARAARAMSSLSLQEAIKPVRKGCAPIGAGVKGKKKSKGDAELPDFVSPPPKNAVERREWVSGGV